jgi:hypothetical protein
LDRNHFNIGLNAVRGAEVEHLLGFTDASDHRPGYAATMQNQWKGLQRVGLSGAPTRIMVPSVLSRFT